MIMVTVVVGIGFTAYSPEGGKNNLPEKTERKLLVEFITMV